MWQKEWHGSTAEQSFFYQIEVHKSDFLESLRILKLKQTPSESG